MELYLVAGANGSGKTTLSKEILGSKPNLYFLNSDELALEINDRTGIKAGKLLLRRVDEYLNLNKAIVVESTISGNHHKHLIQKAREMGYQIYLIYVFLDFLQINICRVKTRVLLGGHAVTEEDIIRRCIRSLKNFEKTKEIVDKWEVYHNINNTFEKIAYGNEHEIVLNQISYKLFKEITQCGH